MALRAAVVAFAGVFLGGCYDEGSASTEEMPEPFYSDGWTLETVDSAAGRGAWNSLAYDASGHPGIAYSGSGTTHDLRLARWNGSAWEFQTVDTGLPAAGMLAFNGSGAPLLAYAKNGNKYASLKFARWNGSSWAIQDIDVNVGAHCSIALDAAGQPAVAYLAGGTTGKNASAKGLKLARKSGSTWTLEVVDSLANGGRMSLQFDAAGNPAIAYSHDASSSITGSDTVKFAKKSGSTWSVQIVDSGVSNFGSSVSLAHDPITGHPSITHGGSTFSQASQPAVRFVSWDGSSWVGETVVATTTGQSAGRASLAFDANGDPIFAFEFLTSGQPAQTRIRRARRVSGSWEFEDIHSWAGSLNGGAATISLAVSQGIPAVCFRASDLLTYARREEP